LRRRFEVEHLSSLSRGYQRNAQRVLDRVEHLCQPRQAADLASPLVGAFIADQAQRGIAPATRLGELAVIAKLIAWAADADLIPRRVKVPRPKLVDKGPPLRILTAEGFADLSSKIDPRMRGLLAVGWLQGLRRGEIVALSWDRSQTAPWIDWEAQRIFFPGASQKSRRFGWLPLAPRLREFLSDRERTGRVLPELTVSLNRLGRQFRAACKQAGYDLRIHDLRRSFGSHYAPRVPAQVLQQLMRHASIAVTLRYYVNLSGSLEAAIALG
jgi:integrase